MTAAALYHSQTPDSSPPMTGALTASMMFHAAMILLVIFGLPHMRKDIPDIADPVPVEIIRAEEVPQTDKKPAATEIRRAPVKEEVKETPVREQMPTVTAKTPPKPIAPQPPVPEDTVTMPREETPDPVAKPEAKPVPPKNIKKPMLTQAKEEEQQEDFQSVLKNLMKPQPAPSSDSQAQDVSEEPSPLAKFAQQMASSELDALREQLSQCWKLMAGARYAEDLVVNVRLTMNPDRTVRDAQVVDQIRYFSDSYYRAAADSALRAVWNPHCNPLQLPAGKYEQWKVMTVVFDPRDML